jgi:hypothetical protein
MRLVHVLRRGGARAIALFVATVVCVGATGLGHTGWDDPTCDPIPVHHDHNAHRFHSGAVPRSSDSDHCLVCHSLRSLRNGLVAVHTPAIDRTPAAAVRVSDIVLAGRLLDLRAPARAPPAQPL